MIFMKNAADMKEDHEKQTTEDQQRGSQERCDRENRKPRLVGCLLAAHSRPYLNKLT